MLARLKIGPRLGIAFGLILLLLLGTVGAGIVGLKSIQKTARVTLDRDVALGFNASAVQKQALELRRYEKDTLINIGDADRVQSYRERWETAHHNLAATLEAGQALSEMAAIDALYQKGAEALAGYARGYSMIVSRIESGQLTSTAGANEALEAYKQSIYLLEEAAADINKAVQERMAASEAAIDSEYTIALWELILSAVVALMLAGILAVVITRSIVRPLQTAVELARHVADGDLTSKVEPRGKDELALLLGSMNEMQQKLSALVGSLRSSSGSVYRDANEMAAGSEELSSRTEQQASALQQTAASMEEITSTVRQNAESADEALKLSGNASEMAESGNRDIQLTIEMMQAISDSSKQIDELVSVIDSIAFQTNILALNASVEAARAGEKGRGFAVVATEVRSLASRSAESAKQVRETVSRTTEHITNGAAQAKRSGESMGHIVESVSRVTSLMGEIATATREQSSAIEQVNAAVSEMDSVTQQNAALVQQTSSSSVSLEGQAKQLAEMVSRFRVNDSQAPFAAETQVRPSPALKRPAPSPAQPQSMATAEEDEWSAF
ncbi:methyl-accepting chemotaxis protein [Salinicola avicenniae]|uniref:methyl-accepting chemotaxis protein n=1 Tax=Salinicola avicenniae TaxID=2916836 RepID=UPI0020748DB5|nr:MULTISPECIES: methyl-accepting chemotaxis protein [unclassified Salinicola]